MASQLLRGFWKFLNTDVKYIPWGELAEKGIEMVVAAKDLDEAIEQQVPNIKKLQPHLQKIEPFLQAFDSPITQVAVSGLPFVSIGIGLFRIYLNLSKCEPNYENSVSIVAQVAYLQSFEEVLSTVNDAAIIAKLEHLSLKSLVENQLSRLDITELSLAEARVVTNRFRESLLAKEFNEALASQLEQAGLSQVEISRLIEQVSWGAHRYLHQAIAEAGEIVKPLAEFYRTGGQQIQSIYDSIEEYLNGVIAPLPKARVFDEYDPLLLFQDIYVPLDIQPLEQSGERKKGAEPISIHVWAQGLLEQPDELRKVMFIEGEAGRGKSIFCRMWADQVRREMRFSFIPLFIRLRNIKIIGDNLTETLEKCPDLEQVNFVQGNQTWLSDKNIRFLIILDGFDELLLEGRATGGLEEFLSQVCAFQSNSHHQCLVTGRSLAIQGVKRLITQAKNLERARIKPMSDWNREQWLDKWQKVFGDSEATQLRRFIQSCPEEIENVLSREPLLIYLIGRLHRERHLTYEILANKIDYSSQNTQVKLKIYRESINWVLDKQRQEQTFRLAGLDDLEDLRGVLREAALCVVQSGNEAAKLKMLKNRFQNSNNSVANLLKQSQETIGESDEKALNNLLTTFYLSNCSKSAASLLATRMDFRLGCLPVVGLMTSL